MDTYIIIAIITAALLFCGLTVILCRRYIKKVFDKIDDVLDSMLIKDPRPPSSHTGGDDRVSKLTHKAGRIVDIYVSEVEQSKNEKETIQSFISDMSHQMKTPLSGITMYTDLLLSSGLSDGEREEFLRRIKSGGEKLQWMMDSLIKMSRLEVGAISLEPADRDIKQTISDAISSVLGIASTKNIDISVAEFSDIELYHDRKWTREAIANILENAVKYSEPGSAIEIAVEQTPLYTKIVITDSGIGINKDEWHMIFKRFYRGHNAKDREGTGLGLYLAALIMEKQGGYIMVDSKPKQYTSFSLFLQNCKK